MNYKPKANDKRKENNAIFFFQNLAEFITSWQWKHVKQHSKSF